MKEKVTTQKILLSIVLLLYILTPFSLAETESVTTNDIFIDETEAVSEAEATTSSGIEIFFENVGNTFTFDKIARIEREINQLNERLAEADKALEAGDEKKADKIRERYETKMETLQKQITRLKERGTDEDYKRLIRIEARIVAHENYAQQFEIKYKGKELTTEQQEAFKAFLETLKGKVVDAKTKVRTKEEALEDDITAQTKEELIKMHAKKRQWQAKNEIEKAEKKIAEFKRKRVERYGKVLKVDDANEEVARAEKNFKTLEARIVAAKAKGVTFKNDTLAKLERARAALKEARANGNVVRARQAAVEVLVADADVVTEGVMATGEVITGFVTETNDENTTSYNSESWKEIIPEDCKNFNDGCNTCEKIGNNIICTEMYCEIYKKPKCLDENETTEAEEVEPEVPEAEDFEVEFEEPESVLEEEFEEGALFNKHRLYEEFNITIPEYSERTIISAEALIVIAKRHLVYSRKVFEEGAFKKALAHALAAREIAKEATSGKYLKLADEDKKSLKIYKEMEKKRAEFKKRNTNELGNLAKKRLEEQKKELEKKADTLEDELDNATTNQQRNRLRTQIRELRDKIKELE